MNLVSNNRSGEYLTKAIFGLLFSALLFYAAIPKLISVFVPYPTLKQTEIIEGTLDIYQSPYRYGGRRSSGRGAPDPQNFVIDSHGVSHKIFLGVRGDHRSRFLSKDFEGLKAKVWFHPLYGIIQGEYEKTLEQIKEFNKKHPHEENINILERPEYAQIFKDKFVDSYEESKTSTEYFIKAHEVENNWGFIFFLSVLIYSLYCIRRFFAIKLERRINNG